MRRVPFARNPASYGVAVAALVALAIAQWPVDAQQGGVPAPTARAAPSAASSRPCRIHGVIASGDMKLPGVSVTARDGDRVAAVTSTDVDGSFVLAVAPGAYTVRAELSAFAPVDRSVTLGQPPCETTTDVAMQLASRVPGAAVTAATPATPAATAPSASTQAAPAGQGRASGAADAAAQNARAGGAGRFGGTNRFQALSVQQSSAAETAEAETLATSVADDPAARLLPPGFSTDAPQEAVTVNGSMVELDRGQLADRVQALGRGEFNIADGAPAGGAGFAQGGIFGGGPGGGPGGGGGRGGPGGGFGGFGLGGRGVGASRLQVSATYGFGGSMFDSAPYALNPNQPTTKPQYLQQSFSTTVGGAVKIPHVYDGTNRTTFNFSYSGSHNDNLFDQYATVPSEAYRDGDFSGSGVTIIDPVTGLPFANNVIPSDRISPAAAALLHYIPTANLAGDTRNYHLSETTLATTNQFTLRITHSLTAPQAGRGAGGGRAGGGVGRGGFGGQGGGANGRGGRGNFQAPLNITLNATVTYRRNDGERANVFPTLGGTQYGSTLSVPITANIRKGRSIQTLGVTFNRTASQTLNNFAFNQDVAGNAGITGVSTNPFDWGVPSLTIGSYTSLRDTTPSKRDDRTWSITYGWTRPSGQHTWRAGGYFSQEDNRLQSDSNAAGTFTFTGLYTADSLQAGTPQAFADFLLGLPQQATRQFNSSVGQIGTPIAITGRSFNLYLQDDWRLKPKWTINYGVQYDVVMPFTEANGQMVNLDASPDFTSVVAVTPGQIGPYSGLFPSGLVRTDWNNAAPRVGVAWRADTKSVVRFGYGLSYNSGTYATIARDLYQQPPYFTTSTAVGTLASPLSMVDSFSAVSMGTITNNYGIDKNYELGMIHQFTADYSRDLFRTWNVGATYIGTRGAHLDMLRAPNRGPDGPLIDDVQSFTWQSSDGSSYMNGLSLRVQKRQSHGISGQATYTLSKSRDDTTATSGSPTVAQDDQNLGAEWGLSNFDRRHQFNGTASIELPFGRNRHWLNTGGWVADVAGDWTLSATLTAQSGTPLTIRCASCAADVAQGVVGTLRADYNGLPIALPNPTANEFFNIAAFSVPAAGTFGTSGRNIVIGPGSHLLNAQLTRDLNLGNNRSLSINVIASNLLNTVNFASIDTSVDSPSFGQVLSVNARRSVRANLRFRF